MLTNRLKRYNWFHNRLIRGKITLVYVPLIIVPLLVLGLAANHIYTKAIVERTVQNVSDNSGLIISQLGGMLENARSAANMLTLNLNKVLAEAGSSGEGRMSELQRYTQITNQLSYALVVFPDVDSAVFMDDKGQVYGSAAALEQHKELAAASPMLERLKASNGAVVWFPMQTRSYFVLDEQSPVLTLGKRIANINTGAALGYLFLNLKESDLSAVYGGIGSVKRGTYMIVDERAQVVSSQHTEEVLQPVEEPLLRQWMLQPTASTEVRQLEQGKTLLIAADIPELSWRLLSLVPYNLLTEETGQLALLISLIGLVCFVIAFIGAGMLSNVIAKPIIRLARHMKKVNEGNLDQQIEVNSADEIGLLASGFNTMLTRVRELLSNIGAEQRKKREYELALMQAQIKPHFLYNTLDVIYTLSEMGRARDVQRTTKSLADFYRSALSQGRDLIELETEVRSLKDYLSIQRIRYSDVFDYTIDIPPDLAGCIIPKLTIQPLVENAIYHGLKHKQGFGKLTIRGSKEGRRIVLTVSDDGAGMAAERLEQVQAGLLDPGRPAGYGLSSVHERIKLYFGEMYGLSVDSDLGAGTSVTATLPLDAWQERE